MSDLRVARIAAGPTDAIVIEAALKPVGMLIALRRASGEIVVNRGSPPVVEIDSTCGIDTHDDARYALPVPAPAAK